MGKFRLLISMLGFVLLLAVSVPTASGHHKSGHRGGTTTTLPATTTTETTVMPTTTTINMGYATDYGADAVLGEALEAQTTAGTQATTGTIAAVLAAAVPGDTILLRAGTYAGFTIPAGTSGNPITVKRYADEAVVINSQFTMNSWTVLAGVKAESTSAQWLTRIGSTTSTAVTNATLRNSTIRGGTTEAIRVRQNANNITLSGLDIEGGLTGHALKFHYESSAFNPSGTVSNVRLRKRNIATGGIFDYVTTEDLIQIEGHNFVTLDRITFGIMQASTSAEDGMDVKTGLGTSPGFLLTRALFEGPFGGEAMIIQSDNDLNTVRDSKIISDSLSVGASGTGDPTATLERLLFTGSGNMIQLRKSGDVPPRAHGVRVIDTTMQGGTFKLGTTTGGDQPHNAEFTGLNLTGTNIIINAGSTYTCTNSTLNGTTGDTLTCT